MFSPENKHKPPNAANPNPPLNVNLIINTNTKIHKTTNANQSNTNVNPPIATKPSGQQTNTKQTLNATN